MRDECFDNLFETSKMHLMTFQDGRTKVNSPDVVVT